MAHQIKQLMKTKGVSREELAGRVDSHPVTISKLISGKMGLTLDWMERLAVALDASIAEVIGLQPLAEADLRDLPVYGVVLGSALGRSRKARGFTLDRSKALAFVRRPASLVAATGAYAVYVGDRSMAPMHSDGELRFVDPARPVVIGDSVVVVTQDHDRALLQPTIKILAATEAEYVHLRQINPEGTIRLSRSVIIAIHHVLTMNELYEV